MPGTRASRNLTLTVQPAFVRQKLLDGNVTRPESHFLDFIIDGYSLLERLNGSTIRQSGDSLEPRMAPTRP
jgi:hypothetical protein